LTSIFISLVNDQLSGSKSARGRKVADLRRGRGRASPRGRPRGGRAFRVAGGRSRGRALGERYLRGGGPRRRARGRVRQDGRAREVLLHGQGWNGRHN